MSTVTASWSTFTCSFHQYCTTLWVEISWPASENVPWLFLNKCVHGVSIFFDAHFLVSCVSYRCVSVVGYCDTCLLETGQGYYRVPGYCNVFAHCAAKSQELQTCAAGTFFDDKKCRHAVDVDCKDGRVWRNWLNIRQCYTISILLNHTYSFKGCEVSR